MCRKSYLILYYLLLSCWVINDDKLKICAILKCRLCSVDFRQKKSKKKFLGASCQLFGIEL